MTHPETLYVKTRNAWRQWLKMHGQPKARAFFAQLTPGRQRLFMGWVGVAKKKETREKRAKESVTLLAKKQYLGMK